VPETLGILLSATREYGFLEFVVPAAVQRRYSAGSVEASGCQVPGHGKLCEQAVEKCCGDGEAVGGALHKGVACSGGVAEYEIRGDSAGRISALLLSLFAPTSLSFSSHQALQQ